MRTQHAWPEDHKAYERLEPPKHMSVFDSRRKDHIQQMLRKRMSGLRPKIIECEQVTHTAWVRPNIEQSPELKHYPRWYVLIEMDKYRKQPDPVETRWQKFLRFVRRQPRPVAAEPERGRIYFSLSKVQFHLLREFMNGGAV